MKKYIKCAMLIFFALLSILDAQNAVKANSEVLGNKTLTYSSHIQNIGWEKDYSKTNGQTSGTTGKSLRLEAIKIKLDDVPSGITIKYQAHIQDIGWQDWKKDGQISGTTGRSLRLEAIKIILEGRDDYTIKYRAHVQNIGWQDWKKDGEISGTTGKSLRLEAIEIKIVPKSQDNNDKNILNGIDVSYHQGTIDWQSVKNSGIDFAIIRAGYRGYGVSSDGTDGKLVRDTKYIENIQGALNANIKVGVYFFSQAINEKEAIEEANFTLNLVKGYNITYPIIIDTETSSHPTGDGRADHLSAEQRTNVVKAFCQTIKNAGYTPMIYANKWWLNENLDMSLLSNYDVWLAHYTGATQNSPLSKPSDYKGNYSIWQYTDKGVVNGINTNVDMNIQYK